MLESCRDRPEREASAVETADLVAYKRDGSDEANSGRRHVCFRGDALNFKAYEVVGDCYAPELLTDAVGRAASNRLLAREQVRLDLVIRDLGFPALVIQLDQLLGRIQDPSAT
jgi:hypothetical protein